MKNSKNNPIITMSVIYCHKITCNMYAKLDIDIKQILFSVCLKTFP